VLKQHWKWEIGCHWGCRRIRREYPCGQGRGRGCGVAGEGDDWRGGRRHHRKEGEKMERRTRIGGYEVGSEGRSKASSYGSDCFRCLMGTTFIQVHCSTQSWHKVPRCLLRILLNEFVARIRRCWEWIDETPQEHLMFKLFHFPVMNM
jgi:hypothetical protein